MSDVSENGFGLAAFSSRGPTRDDRVKPDISAPGVNISAAKANSGNQYVVYSGTSMATPFVSGVIALMLDANPNLTVAQVRDILRTTAEEWGPAGQDVDYGWGRLDAHAAVKRAGNFQGGTAPPVPGHVTFSGTVAAGGRAEHTFTVTDASYPVNATMIMTNWSGSNNPDFDLYVFAPDGSEVGRATGTARQEQVAKRITQTGTYKVEVRSYSGSGSYVIDVSAGLGTATDNPPTVAIEQPAAGATVSGTVTVKVRAADDSAVTKVEVAVDSGAYTGITGNFDGTHYTYTWDTRTAANGAHTLKARATDSAAQTAEASRSVTVSNTSEPDPDPDPVRVQTLEKTGQVSSGARDAEVIVNVHEAGFVDFTLNWATRADLDFYVYAPDGTMAGRAFTLNRPERLRIDTTRFGTGAYRVRVNLYGGTDTDFTLTAAGFRDESYSGSVTPGSRDSVHQRQMGYAGRSRFILAWSGASDLDFFIYDPAGRERGRAYTLNNPELLDVNIDTAGAWQVRVNLYGGPGGAYTLRMIVPEAVLS